MSPGSKKLQIAIDGQTAAGKDTVAREVAAALGCVFIDTGALYRAAAVQVIRSGIPVTRPEVIHELLSRTEFSILIDEAAGHNHILVNGEDVTALLRTSEIDALSTLLARQKDLRVHLIDLQKRIIAQYPRVVVTGRGIGRTVLPDADLKVYLTAELRERVRRRWEERRRSGHEVALETIEQEILDRDCANREREFDPDVPTEDAVRIDTTERSVESLKQEIISLCKK